MKVTNFNLSVSVTGMTVGSGNFSDFNLFDIAGLNSGAIFQFGKIVSVKKILVGIQPIGFFSSSSGSINEAKTNPFFQLELFFSTLPNVSLPTLNQQFAGNNVPPLQSSIISGNVAKIADVSQIVVTHAQPQLNVDFDASTIFLRRLGIQVSKDTTVTDATVVINLSVFWDNLKC